MPTNTPNLNLEKPLGNEKYDVNKINANFDKIDSNALNKLTYKGEVALLTDLPSTNQKIGDYYIVVEKGVPYLWNGTEFKAQVVIPEIPEGGETAQSIGSLISSADVKATPDVDDTFGYSDSEDIINPNILKKLTWGNVRGSLATFFEGIFALVLHGHAISDVTGLQTSLDAKASQTALDTKAPKANPIFTGLIDNQGGQIKFPATQNPSSDANTLDDYEEGTFTPTLVGSTTAGNHTYGNRVGKYIKVGKLVHCFLFLNVSTKDAAMAGLALITGLPFLLDGYSSFVFSQAEGFSMPTSYQHQYAGMITGTTITLRGLSNGSYDAIVASGVASTTYLVGTFTYIAQS